MRLWHLTCGVSSRDGDEARALLRDATRLGENRTRCGRDANPLRSRLRRSGEAAALRAAAFLPRGTSRAAARKGETAQAHLAPQGVAEQQAERCPRLSPKPGKST